MTLADALIAASALAQRIDAIAVDDTPAVRATAVDAEAIRVILRRAGGSMWNTAGVDCLRKRQIDGEGEKDRRAQAGVAE